MASERIYSLTNLTCTFVAWDTIESFEIYKSASSQSSYHGLKIKLPLWLSMLRKKCKTLDHNDIFNDPCQEATMDTEE